MKYFCVENIFFPIPSTFSRWFNSSLNFFLNLSSFLPSDHSRVIGFSFDSNEAAVEFWENVERLISNPENISLSAPGRKRKSMKNKKVKSKPLPPKSQISHPCQFEHITNVTMSDAPRYHSLRLFVKTIEEEIWWARGERQQRGMEIMKMMTRRLNGLKIA